MKIRCLPSCRTASAIHGAVLGIIMTATASAQADPVKHRDPISKLARLVSPKLAEVEERMLWLNRKADGLASYHQFPLRSYLGYRGHRATPDSPDPTITLDFGTSLPIDSIYLIPTQLENVSDSGLFPRRFTLECSDTEDFDNTHTIHRPGDLVHDHISGMPKKFKTDVTARYLRLSVQRGHDNGSLDVFGLSEIFVFSQGIPISFNSTVSTTGELEVSPVWNPAALTDGRSPLGIWHFGEAADDNSGDSLMVTKSGTKTSWTIELDQTEPIDRIIIFPYQLRDSYYTSVVPDILSIELDAPEQSHTLTVRDWSNPMPGSTQQNPLVFSFDKGSARTITITAVSPWILSERSMHALSEIQIWQGNKNLAEGLKVTRSREDETITVNSLTDGFSSQSRIMPIQAWLEQLIERSKTEQELNGLRSFHSQLIIRSKLNLSLGAAITVGMLCMIPVFIIERKRMKSRQHLDIIRKRIAADLHDDIGSNLGSISIIARTARKDLARLEGPMEVDHDLSEVELIARESSLAMRDIVWLLERKQDSIGDLVHRMRETANRLLRNTEFSLSCTSTKTTAKLTLDSKRHLFLFYKEAIHNIVKHSQADKVSIKLWDEGEQLGLEIIDNGVGLPVNGEKASFGVKKLEERAEVMGGHINIESSSDKGTTISFLVKRSKLTNPSTSL